MKQVTIFAIVLLAMFAMTAFGQRDGGPNREIQTASERNAGKETPSAGQRGGEGKPSAGQQGERREPAMVGVAARVVGQLVKEVVVGVAKDNLSKERHPSEVVSKADRERVAREQAAREKAAQEQRAAEKRSEPLSNRN
jgi:hypothetical protein